MVLNNIGEAGQIKRKIYQRRLPEDPSKDYYYILRETGNTEPILIEYGFIDNENDARKLKANLDAYVEGAVKAIAEYAGYTYTPPGVEDYYYTVKLGDTLYSIAREFNTTVQELKRLNNLTSDVLTIGMRLLVKESTDDFPQTIYTVQKGDTLYSIATRYNTTVDILKQINRLTSDILSIGQDILVPELPTEEPTIPPEIPTEPEPSTEIYTVKKGDSLWLIAKKYNTTVDELIRLNNLTTINLQIGDKLLVPSSNLSEETPTYYTVKSGDTLWSIAKAFNTTVDEIKLLNDLSNNLLSIGQQLIVSK